MQVNKIEKRVSDISLIQLSSFRWKQAWSDASFRWSLLLTLLTLAVVGSFLPTFFQYIEQRPGIHLQDYLLQKLPAYDLSMPILVVLYLPLIYILIKGIWHPDIFWDFLIGYTFILVIRIGTLTLTPLEAPEHLIPLMDPLVERFYGNQMINKDLFYSGHTATALWIFFCIRNKIPKLLMLISSIGLMVMLLIQHVHYTIDILGAIIITVLFRYFFLQLKKNIIPLNINGQDQDYRG